MAVEFELKYGADRATLAAIDAAVTGPTTLYHMQTTYYDTADADLAARRITLRRRMENDRSICTLKAPAKLGRAEYELVCHDIQRAIPELCKLADLGTLLPVLEKGVRPVCGAEFTRIAKTLVLAGATAELALDSGFLLGGSCRLPLCEVEVELKSGDFQVVAAYAASLARQYGLIPEKASKFARAQALAQEEDHGV